MWQITKVQGGEEKLLYADYSEAKVRRQYTKYKANVSGKQVLQLRYDGVLLDSYTVEL